MRCIDRKVAKLEDGEREGSGALSESFKVRRVTSPAGRLSIDAML
jgi:hypothetical protein